MKFVYPEIDFVFDTAVGFVNSLVIENQRLMIKILQDIYQQIQGLSGRATVSEENRILNFEKTVELIDRFVPFEINNRSLIGKVQNRIEKTAVDTYYEKTQEVLAIIERFLFDVTFDFSGEIYFKNLSIGNVIKSAGISFREEYDDLSEKLINYMELIREYDRDKLFVFVNLRSYIDNTSLDKLMDTILHQGFNVIMIEGREYDSLPQEKRYIVDKDLCEIS